MSNLKALGCVMVMLGAASYLLSLVNLQFKGLSFLGEYKIYVEVGSIIIGLIFIVISTVLEKFRKSKQD